jgi:alpha-amylase/alpha-mannosidase (GH57 family)
LTTNRTSVVLHGHFYQPPREDPWLDRVPRQPEAFPDHDWNARVERECYRTVVAARILGDEGRVRAIVNTLDYISFNFGPTLLTWLEREAPATYARVLAADRASLARLGHGNAIAMPYHHTILPLADRRDKRTEIRWGIADFRRRFRRNPEGMWLPEAAVDAETLDVLAQEGVRFTILAPHQVAPVPDGGRAGLYRTASGREIALCIYDSELAKGVAFGELLGDADLLVGETFGHHHRFGEMALAAAIERLENRPDVHIENFASLLAQDPPLEEVTLVEPSSWSCAHGVDRWQDECGCKLDPGSEQRQTWRAPLRRAVTWLAGEIHSLYERDVTKHGADPWIARDDYVARLPSAGELRAIAAGVTMCTGSRPEARLVELLELERNALRLFTSCAWFFDDLARVEPIQILRYAARAIDLAGDASTRLEEGFLVRLSEAVSNDPSAGTGADLYRRLARPTVPMSAAVAAGLAVRAALGCTDLEDTGAYTSDLDEDGWMDVMHRPSGRSERYRVTTQGTAPSSIRAQVLGSDGKWTIAWRDLIHLDRDRIRAQILRNHTNLVFNASERMGLNGGRTIEEMLPDAALRAARALAGAATDEDRSAAMAPLSAVADLVEFLEMDPPFAAQTELWGALGGGDSEPALVGLLKRFGFEVGVSTPVAAVSQRPLVHAE